MRVLKPARCCMRQQVEASELALRFNGALQELQLAGLIRDAGRRRREAAVQRLVFPLRAPT